MELKWSKWVMQEMVFQFTTNMLMQMMAPWWHTKVVISLLKEADQEMDQQHQVAAMTELISKTMNILVAQNWMNAMDVLARLQRLLKVNTTI